MLQLLRLLLQLMLLTELRLLQSNRFLITDQNILLLLLLLNADRLQQRDLIPADLSRRSFQSRLSAWVDEKDFPPPPPDVEGATPACPPGPRTAARRVADTPPSCGSRRSSSKEAEDRLPPLRALLENGLDNKTGIN